MLCDQASDEIIFQIITSHSPLLFFYNIIERLSIPRVEINPVHHSGLSRGCTTLHSQPHALHTGQSVLRS